MATSERIQLIPAFVLHQRPYRETSALLDVFTGTWGRTGLVARGIRSPKSRRRGELQPFRPLLVSWIQRGELGTLTAVEANGPAFDLNGSTLFSAFYLNELLVRLLAGQDPHPDLFKYYQACLKQLADKGNMESTLRLFEKRLLEELGYGLLLGDEAVHGTAVQPEKHYDYRLESGPVETEDGQVNGFIFKGSSLLSLDNEQLDNPESLHDAKRLMRAVLNFYLGNKPLKSRELFKKPESSILTKSESAKDSG